MKPFLLSRLPPSSFKMRILDIRTEVSGNYPISLKKLENTYVTILDTRIIVVCSRNAQMFITASTVISEKGSRKLFWITKSVN